MSKTYTLFVEGEDSVDYGSKKTAIKYGNASGKTYQVHSPSGAVVHAVRVEDEENPDGETRNVYPGASGETAPGAEEEDLIGDVSGETTPELSEELPKAGSKKFDVEALKKKISKLLAKAERTENEHERETFNAAAERMMLRLGINVAELEAAGEIKPEEVVETHRDWKGNYSISMVPFVATVARGFGNITILQSNFSAMLRRTYAIGLKSDVEQFNRLTDSLSLQVISALHRWQKENIESRRGLTDMEKYVQHRSFIEGFSTEVSRRLRELRAGEEEQASTGAALVLASKQERIDGWVSEKYGDLSARSRGAQRYSSLAASYGRAAGKTANLGEKSVGGKRGALR